MAINELFFARYPDIALEHQIQVNLFFKVIRIIHAKPLIYTVIYIF